MVPVLSGRLVRNDAGGGFGAVPQQRRAHVPARYLDSGLYHLLHLRSSRQEREHKVERYRNVDAALRATAADPYLSSYYVPEQHPDALSAELDPRDWSTVDAVLAPADAALPLGPSAPRVQRVSRNEVQARWAERDFDDAGYGASIALVDTHRELLTDDDRRFRVCVRNEGSEWWPGGEDRRPLVRAAYRWLTPQGAIVDGEGHRTALPRPLAPGDSCLMALNVVAPPIAGRYLLAPDLVHEHVRWFQCRSEPVEVLVTAPSAAPR